MMEILRTEIDGKLVYGWTYTERRYLGKGEYETTERMIPFNRDEIPKEMYVDDIRHMRHAPLRACGKYLPKTDLWKPVPEEHYYSIREKIMDIIEAATIVDTECDGKAGDDCRVKSFAIDKRDEVFQQLRDAVLSHYSKYGIVTLTKE